MRTAVITTVHGRPDHLRRQQVALDGLPVDRVVVAMNDRDVAGAALHVEDPDGLLPLARARNLGAEHALEAGSELLVFLDVDCIPSPALLPRYEATAADGVLLCGPVGYLPPMADYPVHGLRELAEPHRARPVPEEHEVLVNDNPDLFWSLSFACTASTWRAVGGFHEGYRGYGGEDTDFARSALSKGIGSCWVGGAWAFHQHHDSPSPPVQHLDDILRNAAVFHERWGSWPMRGWLNAFADQGLISFDGTRWRRA